MIHIALQTEFTFKQSYLHMKDINKHAVNGVVGVADLNSTFGHVGLEKHVLRGIPAVSGEVPFLRGYLCLARGDDHVSE